MLADIHFVQPEVLGRSQVVLTDLFLKGLSDEQVTALQPRLVAIVGEFSTGFFRRAREMILAEQEAIRRALLDAQNQLEETARQSEERYRKLVESANQAIFIVDRQGVFRFMNGSAARQLGDQPQSFLGRTMWDLFPQPFADKHMVEVRAVLDAGSPKSTESQTVLQGKHRWRETSLQPLKNDAGDYDTVLGISSDITERKEAEATLKRYSERLRVLHEIDRGVLATHSPKAIAEVALKHVRRLIPSWGAAVVMFDLEKYQYEVLAGEAAGFRTGKRYPITDRHILESLEEGDTVVVDDICETGARSPAWSRLAELGQRALLNVPLTVRGELIGVFAMTSERPGAYTQEHVKVSREIASSLAVAIQDARLLEAERAARKENIQLLAQVSRHADELEQRVTERTEELSTLYEIAAVANKYLDLQSVFDLSLVRALDAVHCRMGTIHLVDEEEESLRLVSSAGITPEFLACLNSIEESGELAERVLETGTVVTETFRVDELSDMSPYVGAPITARGLALGVLSVMGEPGHRFTFDDTSLLSSIANHMAGAVEKARLLQKTEQVAVMEERQRLARELHDSVSQALYSLTLFAEAAQECIQDGKTGAVQRHLDDIDTTAHQALKEMRLMLYELRTTATQDEGLIETLRHRMEAVETRAGVKTRLRTEDLEKLPSHVEEGLQRIAQEALNNTLKHAGATEIAVDIRMIGEDVVIEIADNGQGFDPDNAMAQGGMGLKIMHERAEKLNGRVSVLSRPGEGTSIVITVGVDGLKVQTE
jgi:PAS domain S-box-containing protein